MGGWRAGRKKGSTYVPEEGHAIRGVGKHRGDHLPAGGALDLHGLPGVDFHQDGLLFGLCGWVGGWVSLDWIGILLPWVGGFWGGGGGAVERDLRLYVSFCSARARSSTHAPFEPLLLELPTPSTHPPTPSHPLSYLLARL